MLKTACIAGVPVTVGTLDSVSDQILETAQTDPGGYVCVCSVHELVTARSDKSLLTALEGALIVTSDGMPLVWELRHQGYDCAERVAGTDLTPLLCKKAGQVPIFFYGGSAATIAALEKEITRRFPELTVAGYESPPLLPTRPSVDLEVVERIKASGARIVFVGLGCPKQEHWMAAHAPHLPAVLIGIGAAFNFMAGDLKRAPLWMQRNGLEWLFRLACEPRRLWKRYFVTNSLFIWHVAGGRIKRLFSKR